jgi:serine/threonine protein kinase
VPDCPQCASAYSVPARFCGQCGASLPASAEESEQPDPWIGRIVDRRYRVLSRIGAGGMGLVYRVEHMQLAKVAAMKVLHAETATDSEAVRRFRTEAQAVSRLSHPNIVQTFDFGQSEGALYLVMEYVRGDDLAVIVKRDGPMPFDRAAQLFVQICSALTEAHEAGVIHRDLKPENIVVVARREGTEHAKVLDFGLAKLREKSDSADVTTGAQVIGTPYYMSPEQVRSEPLDARTDIYSLGATLYRVLTGTPPFQAPTPVGVLTMHITDPLEPLRVRAPNLNLPPEADAIVGRAMAKSRENRYSSAAEVQAALELAISARRRSITTVGQSDGAATDRLPKPDVALSSMAARSVESVDSPRYQSASRQHVAAPDSAESGDFSSDKRLRRQEFDEFEYALRRKKRVTSLVVPALLLLLVGGGVWAVGRAREKASSVEREPNDTPAQATLLPLDTPVLGRIDERLSGGQPDMDYFHVPIGKGPRVVSARLEGIPDVDLVMELFDAQGATLGKVDAHGVGGGEWLQPTAIGPTDAYLLVRQVWIQGTMPFENVQNPYRLAVHWIAPTAGWETEPNDWPERANVVQLGQSIRGYLAEADDKDWFAFTPKAAGTLVGRVAPPEGVEIAVTIGDPAKADRPEKKNEHPNEISLPVKPGERLLIGLARKIAPTADKKSEVLVGLDDSYELKLDLHPQR